MPVVEIISFHASEALIADPTLGHVGRDYLKKCEGCISLGRGFQSDDKTKVITVVVWESYGHYENMTKRDDYAGFLADFKCTLASGLLLQHVEFKSDPANAFHAPITEMSTFKVKEGHSQAELDGVIAEIAKNQHLAKGMYPPLAWGEVKQTPGTYILFIGWDSVEADMNSVKVAPNDALVAKLYEIADIDLKYVALDIFE
ncbi:hypothetical protein B0H34DRAFT_440812 [Crassisporium funariophilum]|nr:hypothetical protein B0H34DRAFT_440812 [Crassisporium funariophilum]